MTKKSFARQQRDEFRREASARSKDLKDIQDSQKQLLGANLTLTQEFGRKNIIENLEDPTLVEKNLKILERDTKTMKTKLDELDTRGETLLENLKKKVDSPMVQEYMDLMSSYDAWMDEHQQLVIPTVTVLLEELQKAENKCAAQVKEARNAAGVNAEITPEAQEKAAAAITGEDQTPAPARGESPLFTPVDEAGYIKTEEGGV